MSLPNRLETWFFIKVVKGASQRLQSQHLGQKLKAEIQASLEKDRAEVVLLEISEWLTQVANEAQP